MKTKTIFLLVATLLTAAALVLWLMWRPPANNNESGTKTIRAIGPPPNAIEPVIPVREPPSPDGVISPAVKQNPDEIAPSPVVPGFGRRGGREGLNPPPPP